jgi:hypothetical protein
MSMKTIHSLSAVCVLCFAAIGCGAAPDGVETEDPSNGEGTTPVPSSTIRPKACPDGPCGGGGSGGGGSQPSDKFRVHLSGIWFPNSCDSGWEGDAGEFYWTITGTGWTQVTIEHRPADASISIGPTGDGGWRGLNLNVTKDIWGPRGQPMTMYGSAGEWDAWFEGGDDWLGQWTQPILWDNLPANGQPQAFWNTGQGGEEFCTFGLEYEVSRAF